MTPEQLKMVARWEEHTRCEFEEKNVDATMQTMCEGAYVNNVAVLTGGDGLDGVRAFYANSFLPNLPKDTETVLISRTVGDTQIVDELIFKFTHTIEMPWMLPGVKPTGKRVEVPLVAIIGFTKDQVSYEHIYWDQATILVQIGLLDADKLPVSGIASANKMSKISQLRHD
jgi:carboxymethylenebutenolidase